MARRIEVRERGRILLLFLLIAGLPLYVRYELHRVAKEVDTIVDEGIGGLDLVEDLMQTLLDARASVLDLMGQVAGEEDEVDALAALDRDIAVLPRQAADLIDVKFQRLIHDDEDSLLRQQLREAESRLKDVRGRFERPIGDELDFIKRVTAASLAIDTVADTLHRLTTKVGSRAHIADAEIPSRLERSEIGSIALAALCLVMLAILAAHSLSTVPSLGEIQKALRADMIGGSLIDAADRPIAIDGDKKSKQLADIKRVIHRHPTHVTFVARVEVGGQRLRCWGKRYTFLGALRGALVPWPRMYAMGTWRCLVDMHRAGIRGPTPIAFATQRRFGFPVGHFVIAEHVRGMGPATNEKFWYRFFKKASAEQRRFVLEKLGNLVRGAHSAGILAVKPRYLHVVGLPPSGSRLERDFDFVLGDLDKAVRLPGAPQFVRSMVQRRDRQKILEALGKAITSEEREFLERRMVA